MPKLDKKDFIQGVYEIVRLVPYGRATSYGAVARAAGYPTLSRMVGRVLGECCSAETHIPAYRVVNSQGILSGKEAFSTPTEMQEKLEAEGVIVMNDRIQNWKSVCWNPLDELGLE